MKVYCNKCGTPLTITEEDEISDTNDVYKKCPACEGINHYNIVQELRAKVMFKI